MVDSREVIEDIYAIWSKEMTDDMRNEWKNGSPAQRILSNAMMKMDKETARV